MARERILAFSVVLSARTLLPLGVGDWLENNGARIRGRFGGIRYGVGAQSVLMQIQTRESYQFPNLFSPSPRLTNRLNICRLAASCVPSLWLS